MSFWIKPINVSTMKLWWSTEKNTNTLNRSSHLCCFVYNITTSGQTLRQCSGSNESPGHLNVKPQRTESRSVILSMCSSTGSLYCSNVCFCFWRSPLRHCVISSDEYEPVRAVCGAHLQMAAAVQRVCWRTPGSPHWTGTGGWPKRRPAPPVWTRSLTEPPSGLHCPLWTKEQMCATMLQYNNGKNNINNNILEVHCFFLFGYLSICTFNNW